MHYYILWPVYPKMIIKVQKCTSFFIKEGLMEVNRQLVDIASSENLPLKLTGKPGRVTADQLENTLSLFKWVYSQVLIRLKSIMI